MPNKMLALVVTALAAIALVGCRQPVGLSSGTVHAAAIRTVYCPVSTVEEHSGYVSMWAGSMLAESAFDWHHNKMTRGYHVKDTRPYPRNYGYCSFNVPFFIPILTPVCTLFYYQIAHNGSVNLDVDWLDLRTTLDWNPDFIYHAAETSSYTIATDAAQANDGWHKVALTQDGCNKVLLCATQNVELITGWIYTGSIDDDDSATVSLTSNGPYIKVVYDDGQ
jgi:hypothetical protein